MLEIILIINIVVLLHNTQDINIIIVILLHQSIMREESLWKASLIVTNWIIYLIEIIEPGQKSPRHKFWERSCKWSDGLNQSTMFVVWWNYNIVHKTRQLWKGNWFLVWVPGRVLILDHVPLKLSIDIFISVVRKV